ncbi:MAG: MFS transporter [Ilumatobacteraceae bacterium]
MRRTERKTLGADYRKLFSATTISNLGDGVGVIAYPWLASAITRNPLLIALIAAAQRLPWLVFTLPAGVYTDRHDRRRLMIGANAARAVLTAIVGVAVLARQDVIPAPDQLEQVVGTEWLLYLFLLVATMLLGTCEVIYDNSAQTFLPAIVATTDLERANGRMYSAELVANQFAGPPLAGLLLLVAFAVPVFFDAASFAASAALVFAIAATPPVTAAPQRQPFRRELAEGFSWLWRHDVIRTLALALAGLNLLGNMSTAVLVIYAQEVLDTSVAEFTAFSIVSAIGGIVGGWMASWVSRRVGSGTTLALTLWVSAVASILIAFTTSWLVAALLLFVWLYTGVLWNVITVSFRQTVIPDRLLGRVNSVYRFFGWGVIPIGAALGGLLVVVLEGPLSRDWALRMPWLVAGIAQLALAAWAVPRLTTSKLEAARAGTGITRAADASPR